MSIFLLDGGDLDLESMMDVAISRKDRLFLFGFVLEIACLEGQFGINCPSAFLKILK